MDLQVTLCQLSTVTHQLSYMDPNKVALQLQRKRQKGLISRIYFVGMTILKFYCHLFSSGVKYKFAKHKKLEEIPKCSACVAIVTGGTKGIGKEVVGQMLKADMRVIIGCRDPKKGNIAVNELRTEGITTGSAKCMELDLLNLKSVKRFGEMFLNLGLPLNVLVNNAATFSRNSTVIMTEDKLEPHFQVNYLSHFVLTLTLLPALIKGGSSLPSRVINVTCVPAACMGRVTETESSPILAYCNSKLMQLISTFHLQKQFKNFPIRFFAAHPAPIVKTELMLAKFGLLSIPASQAASSVVYACLSKDIGNVGGLLISNCKVVDVRKLGIRQLNSEQVQTWLYQLSCRLGTIDGNVLEKREKFPKSNILAHAYPSVREVLNLRHAMEVEQDKNKGNKEVMIDME